MANEKMTTNSSLKILGYGHTGITVRSISKSLAFWKDLLGLPIIWQTTVPVGAVPGDPTHTITGAPVGTTMHVVYLGLPQTVHAQGSSDPTHLSTLELTQYDLPTDLPADMQSRPLNGRSWDVGAVHVNLMVHGLDDLLDKARAQGWEVVSGIFKASQDTPTARARGHRICYLRGPDCELVELTEIPVEQNAAQTTS